MKHQLSLTYSPDHAGRESWAKQLETIRSAVNHIGLKEVSFALDVSGSMLSDALNERDRKRWAAQWTHVIKAMLVAKRDDIADGLLRTICQDDLGVTMFELADPLDLTPQELAVLDKLHRRTQARAR